MRHDVPHSRFRVCSVIRGQNLIEKMLAFEGDAAYYGFTIQAGGPCVGRVKYKSKGQCLAVPPCKEVTLGLFA